jgi:hypothetical protein
MIMGGSWVRELLDIERALVHGDFEDGKNVYMKVPESLKKCYDPMYYALLPTIYGLKQSAMAFWQKLLHAFRRMNFACSKADPCLYLCWQKDNITLWIYWIDDCLVAGEKKSIEEVRQAMIDRFDCDIVGNMDEYVGCKLEWNFEEFWIKVTQPILLQQSYTKEFNLGTDKVPNMPADPEQVLMPCKEENTLPEPL